jgi:hypothetical protein
LPISCFIFALEQDSFGGVVNLSVELEQVTVASGNGATEGICISSPGHSLGLVEGWDGVLLTEGVAELVGLLRLEKRYGNAAGERWVTRGMGGSQGVCLMSVLGSSLA